MPKISILAIESSADETGAAVLQGDIKLKKFQLLSNVIYSQIKIHQKGRANLISHFHYYDTFPKRRHKIQVKK